MTSWTTRLRPIKYRLRCLLLCVSPNVYWTLRKALKGHKEPEIVLVPHLCHPGQISLDIGANFGAYTFHMSRHSRACHAFEPLPFLARTLRTAFRRAPVIIHEVAVSDRPGRAALRAPRADIGYSTIEPANPLAGKIVPDSPIDELEVKVVCLDACQLGEVCFLKIDVEGHEAAVLHGGRELLQRCRPSILVEVEHRHCPGSFERVMDLLLPLEYVAYHWIEGGLHVCPIPQAGDRYADPTGGRNVLFLQPDVARHLMGTLGQRPAA